MANSTMLGLLGREAAHTGQRITWQQMWDASQDFAPDTLEMGDSFPVTPTRSSLRLMYRLSRACFQPPQRTSGRWSTRFATSYLAYRCSSASDRSHGRATLTHRRSDWCRPLRPSGSVLCSSEKNSTYPTVLRMSRRERRRTS
jgi:hypothetical protein